MVATVGPACRGADVLSRLIEAGVGVLRLNLSHGELGEHLELLEIIRSTEERLGVPVAVMADLPGPKIRLHACSDTEILEGAVVDVQEGDLPSTDADVRLALDATGVVAAIEPGHRVLLDDGQTRLLAVGRREIDGTTVVRCNATCGGSLRPRVGINLPDSDPDLAAVTGHDLELAVAMARAGVDLIAVSFVHDGDDLRGLRATLLEAVGPAALPGLVSKIERPSAVRNLEDIVEASDAVLVARGDLGVELDIAEVPVVQKRVVGAAVRAGRPVIVATQMLQSMIESPGPTRAEATDAANAVLDGADALMLSGETAIGRHPVLAVEVLRRIARTTEAWHDDRPHDHGAGIESAEDDDPWLPAIARGAQRIAAELPASIVVAWSQTGTTALVLSRGDLRIPLVVLTDDPRAARRMRLLRGVVPVTVEPSSGLGSDRDAFLATAQRVVLERSIGSVDSIGVFVHGSRREIGKPTDALGVFTIGEGNRA